MLWALPTVGIKINEMCTAGADFSIQFVVNTSDPLFGMMGFQKGGKAECECVQVLAWFDKSNGSQSTGI